MSSPSPTAGLNPLMATESSALKDQTRSFTNPDNASKSLNTKEFSEVLDDHHAQQKVSSNSKISDSVQDHSKKEGNELNVLSANAEQKSVNLSLEVGNVLPLTDESLPQALSFLLGSGLLKADGSWAADANFDNLNMSTLKEQLAAFDMAVMDEGLKVALAGPMIKDQSASASTQPTVSAADVMKSNSDLATNPVPVSSVPSLELPKEKGSNKAADAPSSRLDKTKVNSVVMNTEVADRLVQSSKVNSSQQQIETNVTTNVASSATTNPTTVANPISASDLPFKLQSEGLSNKANMDKAQFDSLLASAGAGEKLSSSKDTALSSWSMTDATQVYKIASQSITSANTAVDMTKAGFSEAVMQKVMWMSSQQINKAEISLDPPELGALQVRISTNADQTSVIFSSQNGAVREALDLNLHRLREMLEQQGLNLADVDVSDQGTQQQQRSDNDPTLLAKDAIANGQQEEGDEQFANKPVDSSLKTLSLVDQYV